MKSNGKFQKELDIDINRFVKHFLYLIIILVLFHFVSSFFHGRYIEVLGEEYNLELILILVFVLIFSPIITAIIMDTRKLLDLVSKYLLKKFPGMEDEVSPVIKTFRDLVYIILLFLVSVPFVPLFSKYHVFGINLMPLVSLVFLVVLIIFLYDITQNIIKITKGQVSQISAMFIRLINKLAKK